MFSHYTTINLVNNMKLFLIVMFDSLITFDLHDTMKESVSHVKCECIKYKKYSITAISTDNSGCLFQHIVFTWIRIKVWSQLR